jgi:hypothetical protein
MNTHEEIALSKVKEILEEAFCETSNVAVAESEVSIGPSFRFFDNNANARIRWVTAVHGQDVTAKPCALLPLMEEILTDTDFITSAQANALVAQLDKKVAQWKRLVKRTRYLR